MMPGICQASVFRHLSFSVFGKRPPLTTKSSVTARATRAAKGKKLAFFPGLRTQSADWGRSPRVIRIYPRVISVSSRMVRFYPKINAGNSRINANHPGINARNSRMIPANPRMERPHPRVIAANPGVITARSRRKRTQPGVRASHPRINGSKNRANHSPSQTARPVCHLFPRRQKIFLPNPRAIRLRSLG